MSLMARTNFTSEIRVGVPRIFLLFFFFLISDLKLPNVDLANDTRKTWRA